MYVLSVQQFAQGSNRPKNDTPVAEEVKAGIVSKEAKIAPQGGGKVDVEIFQYVFFLATKYLWCKSDGMLSRVPETLPHEVVFTKMHAKKLEYKIATPKTLEEYDAFLFGIPTRYGNMPAQLKVC